VALGVRVVHHLLHVVTSCLNDLALLLNKVCDARREELFNIGLGVVFDRLIKAIFDNELCGI
jgi:hypothetical protein